VEWSERGVKESLGMRGHIGMCAPPLECAT
jgi:hypothetical protein